MSELADVREAVAGCRVVLKGTQRMLRTTLQFLTDLEQRLGEIDSQPREAQSDEQHHLSWRVNGADRVTAGAATYTHDS